VSDTLTTSNFPEEPFDVGVGDLRLGFCRQVYIGELRVE
jgi:hypothetical protein